MISRGSRSAKKHPVGVVASGLSIEKVLLSGITVAGAGAMMSARRSTRRMKTRKGSSIVICVGERTGDTPTSRRAGKKGMLLEQVATPSSARAMDSPSRSRDMMLSLGPDMDSPRSRSAPSRRELARLFDTLSQGMGRVGLHAVTEAALELSEKYQLGLELGDMERLMAFLEEYNESVTPSSSTEPYINRKAFVSGFRDLGIVLAQVKTQNLSASQLCVVVGAAFKHFDLDSDGKLTVEELKAATQVLGLELSEYSVEVLHRFIAPTCVAPFQSNDAPIWEQIGNAFQATWEQTQRRYSFDSVNTIMARMSKVPETPSSRQDPFGFMQKQVCEIAEHWADAFELAVTTVGMTVAAQYACDCLDGVQAISSADPSKAAPFLTFLALGVMDMAKSVDEMQLKEMTVDEALLYAVVFRNKGISQVQFRRMLSLKGCRWTVSGAGETLNESDDRLMMMVKGRAQTRTQATAVPGTLIGAATYLRNTDIKPLPLVAKVGVTCVSWDSKELRELLDHDSELSLAMDKVFAAGISTNLQLYTKEGKRSGSKSGAALAPVQEADDGMALTKRASTPKRMEDFLEEVRWVKLQLLTMRRRARESKEMQGLPLLEVVDTALTWMDTATKEIRCDVERRGLLRTWYACKQIVDSIQSPKSAQDALSKVGNSWHALDELVNFNNVLSDYSGAMLLVYGAWLHLCSMNGTPVDDLFDPTQFAVLAGICGTRWGGKLFRSKVEDLPEEEAKLYTAGGFEEAGFTAGEFRHLVKAGAAKVMKLAPGEVKVVGGIAEPALYMCMEGNCLVCGNCYPDGMEFRAREFLGQNELGVQDPVLTCSRQSGRLQAVEETTMLVWDMEQLKEILGADGKLQMKMLRMVTLSMADRLLRNNVEIEDEGCEIDLESYEAMA